MVCWYALGMGGGGRGRARERRHMQAERPEQMEGWSQGTCTANNLHVGDLEVRIDGKSILIL